jgi:hypothetical protein
MEGSRQVILEWERPAKGSASASTPPKEQPPLPQPEEELRGSSPPRRSVYEVRGETSATIRR